MYFIRVRSDIIPTFAVILGRSLHSHTSGPVVQSLWWKWMRASQIPFYCILENSLRWDGPFFHCIPRDLEKNGVSLGLLLPPASQLWCFRTVVELVKFSHVRKIPWCCVIHPMEILIVMRISQCAWAQVVQPRLTNQLALVSFTKNLSTCVHNMHNIITSTLGQSDHPGQFFFAEPRRKEGTFIKEKRVTPFTL